MKLSFDSHLFTYTGAIAGQTDKTIAASVLISGFMGAMYGAMGTAFNVDARTKLEHGAIEQKARLETIAEQVRQNGVTFKLDEEE